MRVTMHHNFFDRISLRGPQMVYGWMHYFNNYQYRSVRIRRGFPGRCAVCQRGQPYQARPTAAWWSTRRAAARPNPCGDNDLGTSTQALVAEWAGNGIGNTRSTNDLLLEGAVVSVVEPHRRV